MEEADELESTIVDSVAADASDWAVSDGRCEDVVEVLLLPLTLRTRSSTFMAVDESRTRTADLLVGCDSGARDGKVRRPVDVTRSKEVSETGRTGTERPGLGSVAGCAMTRPLLTLAVAVPAPTSWKMLAIMLIVTG